MSLQQSVLGPRKRLVDLIDDVKESEWGFTGTRAGMTGFQRDMTKRVLKMGQPLMFRHGGAFGSDFEAHAIWSMVCKHTIAEVWPADPKRAELFQGQLNTRVQPIMPPLVRNIEIVTRSTFLLAIPHTEVEEQRSGTWQTIREALKINRPILIIWPFTKRMTFYHEKKLYRITYTG